VAHPPSPSLSKHTEAENPDLSDPACTPVKAHAAISEIEPLLHDSSVRRIVLTGFMGAGKSTVGRLLAAQLQWRFIDVDDEIEAAFNATIAQLFQQKGEPWFREQEHETIHELISQDSIVLGLGGGAIEDPRTRDILLSAGGTTLVHLQATLETVLTRCQGTETVRPVLADRSDLEARYQRRLPLYNQAHHTLAVDHLTPEETARSLQQILGL
jgi:shikimate kinase